MKTFEQEYEELSRWFRKAYAEAEARVAALPIAEGYDDRSTLITRDVHMERNRRLRELKKKYGMPME